MRRRTLGGWQWWTDRRISHDGWRVQSNPASGRHRLLDPKNRLQHVGASAECIERFEQHAKQLPPPPACGCLLLHGLGRSRRSMSPIARHLRTTGLATYEMEYASTRGHFRDHVAALADVVKHLPMHARLSVVTHSMGGLVLRGYMQQYGERHAAWHRVVMIAPPNEGSAVARGLNRLPVVGTAFRLVMGRSGRSIAEWRDLPTMLAKQMPVPTLVLAATTWPLQGHDGILSADETRLTAAEYVEVPGNHTFVLNDAAVHDRVASYLYDAACD